MSVHFLLLLRFADGDAAS